MRVLYRGVDISDQVRIKTAEVFDYAGYKVDRVRLVFVDEAQRWMRWGPQKGDMLRLKQEGFDTGDLYVHALSAGKGFFTLGAVSAPGAIRDSGTRNWENIRLRELLHEFAERAGLRLETYGMEAVNPLYTRLSQQHRQDLDWLAFRLMLERCLLKIHHGALVAFFEPWLEARPAGYAWNLTQGEAYQFATTSLQIYAGCTVKGSYEGSFTAPQGSGPWLSIDTEKTGLLEVDSLGEAERYAMGFLRLQNKREHTANLTGLPLLDGLAGGSMVEVTISGNPWSGRWLVDRAHHDLVKKKTHLKLRKPLEGY